MRKTFVVLLVLGSLLVACGSEEDTPGAGGSTAAAGCDLADPPLFEDGVLSVATDRPAYEPWFKGSPDHYSGFEGELATEIAERMDLPIKWVVEPFNKSYAPGSKEYDFDVNQITITPERDEVVDFSDGYFDNNEGLLAMEGTPIADATSIEELKDYVLGAQVGTTSLAFINSTIQPSEQPKVFDTTNDSKSALESGQIDGLITDVVTTVYLRDFEIKGSTVVGQFAGGGEFGMLFEEGNPLVDCVNQVLEEVKSDGTLEHLEHEWLTDYLGVPELSG
ncbi:MAG TPA: ABC transporter substrate-binding protein [Actinomycetota bacterium]|jgi:polar amino acid transport system substrate-binding protein